MSSLFNSMGRSKIPLGFLVLSTFLNIMLDIVFVACFKMGVEGVAYATLIAQGLSAVLSMIVFFKSLKKFNCGKAPLFSKSVFNEMFGIALPSIFQQVTITVGMMLVQAVVNTFGSDVLAGFSAAMRVEWFFIVPMTAIGSALSSYCAQNIGAGKLERVPQGLKAAWLVIAIYAIGIAFAMELGNHQIAALFLGANGSAKAYEIAQNYMAITGWFYCIMGFKNSTDSILRGSGDMKMFMIGNFVNLGIRVAMAFILAPTYGMFVIAIALPLGWLANFIISAGRYKQGKWKKIYVKGN